MAECVCPTGSGPLMGIRWDRPGSTKTGYTAGPANDYSSERIGRCWPAGVEGICATAFTRLASSAPNSRRKLFPAASL